MVESKVRIGKWSAIAMLVNFLSTKIFLTLPRDIVETAGTAVWILVLYVSTLAAISFLLISSLYSKFQGKDLVDIGEKLAGGVGRVVVGIISMAFFFLATSITLREFAENMKTIAFKLSPISFVMVFFVGAVIFAAYSGLEAISRMHLITVPIIIIGFIIIMLGVSQNFEFTNLLPFWGNGVSAIFGWGTFKLSIYADVILIFFLSPYIIHTHKDFKFIGFVSIGISAAFMLLSVIMFLGALPYPAAIENLLPIYQLGRIISYGRLFQRIESLFIVIWVISALLYLSSAFYFLVNTFKKTFKLSYHQPTVLAFAIIVFNLSLLPQSLMAADEMRKNFFDNLGLILTFVLAVILLIMARIFKKKAKGGKARC